MVRLGYCVVCKAPCVVGRSIPGWLAWSLLPATLDLYLAWLGLTVCKKPKYCVLMYTTQIFLNGQAKTVIIIKGKKREGWVR